MSEKWQPPKISIERGIDMINMDKSRY